MAGSSASASRRRRATPIEATVPANHRRAVTYGAAVFKMQAGVNIQHVPYKGKAETC